MDALGKFGEHSGVQGGGGGGDAIPHKVFLEFSETNYHLHLLFSVVVRTSLTQILTQDWRALVAVVTRYYVISSRW